MNERKLEKKIFVSITGIKKKDWKDKINEINKRKIKKVSLFLSAFPKEERKGLNEALLSSCIKEIPLVHLRGQDDGIEVIEFFQKNFKTKYFNIHEDAFDNLKKWKGYEKKLLLELNYDGKLEKNVKVKKVGGFCIDLSHFKASQEKWSKEFLYVINRRKIKKYFKSNHLNGYDYKKNRDVHVVKSLKQFEYLKTLPKFLFGKIIAIETWNTIEEQLKFKKKIIKILKDKL